MEQANDCTVYSRAHEAAGPSVEQPGLALTECVTDLIRLLAVWIATWVIRRNTNGTEFSESIFAAVCVPSAWPLKGGCME